MTESDAEPAAPDTDEHPAPATEPGAPRTGEPAVDRALESVQDLESAPLSDHHDRLARAHEELHRALNTDQEQPGEESRSDPTP